MTARRVIAGLALVLAAATGCSEQDTQGAVDSAENQAREEAKQALEEADLPNVDWGKYSDDLQQRLDEAAANVDCAALEEELAKLEKNDTEVTEYIKTQIEELNC